MNFGRMGTIFAIWIACNLICARVYAAPGQNRTSWTMDSVIRQLDDTSKTFRSLSANVERTKVTVVVDDRSTETGTIVVRDDKMLLTMDAPDSRSVLRTGDDVYVYTPGLKRVEQYNLGKNRGLADQFLELGFGTSGKELHKSYLITVLGEPSLDDRKTVEIELTPKSDQLRNQFSKIQIWFDESSWLPVQQQFYENGSGDYLIIRYSNIARNPAVDDSRFKPHWPKGTEKIRMDGASTSP